jgi:hypothetical protein
MVDTESPTADQCYQEDTLSAHRSPIESVTAGLYLAGGALGLVMTVSTLAGQTVGALMALAWLILLAQIAAAIYGGVQLWRRRTIGLQLLYWLSWSCVPALATAAFSYWCAIGLGAFPTLSVGLGNLGTSFNFSFGYESNLSFLPGGSGIMVGVNVIALAFAVTLHRYMAKIGVPARPLRWPHR